ncbi:MAG: hypothetical protein E7601_00065 [Ruminococcaceae bacterium]|nr:hypothetical protein [Oscillospiraceae bacterium]
MDFFTDIHTHIVPGIDDGAKSYEDSMAMIEAAYNDGTRRILFSPHYYPAGFGDTHERALSAYEKLSEICKEKYPDLKLFLGNELHYTKDCTSHIQSGKCRTMNGTDYVMIDFTENEKDTVIVKSMQKILNTGYRPVLAHAERYVNLPIDKIDEMHRSGIVIQVNAQSILGRGGFKRKHRVKKLLAGNIADIVSSDCHDIKYRPPLLRECYVYVANKYGESYADYLFGKTACKLFELE